MLGWKVYVKKESDTLIASWCVGLGGLAWINSLVKEGSAQDLGGNGYPNSYSVRADVLLPKIYPNPPLNEGANLVIGEDYILSGSNSWNVDLNQAEIEKCDPSEILIIEGWDLS